jgi:hypothetical protein
MTIVNTSNKKIDGIRPAEMLPHKIPEDAVIAFFFACP